jgi:hypothetical protein
VFINLKNGLDLYSDNNKQILETMTTEIIKMLKNIDSHSERTLYKTTLNYDKKTLSTIIKEGYVTVIGDKITRKYHGKNY